MLMNKLLICLLASFFCLVLTGAGIAGEFDHSMTFSSAEIDTVPSMYVDSDDIDYNAPAYSYMESDDIDSGPFLKVASNVTDFGDSMTFTSDEIASIGPTNRIVLCTQNC